MEAPITTDQMRALASIYMNIFLLVTLKAVRMIVPPIGVSRRGVMEAIPIGPNFFHVFTMALFFLLNFFADNLKFQCDLNQSPKKVTKSTDVIMPVTVTVTISSRE